MSEPYKTITGFDVSFIPAEILYNILVWLPVKNSFQLKCVCKHWNRVISDPCYLNSWRYDRKILLPFVPVDVFYETDTIRSMVTLSPSSFSNPGLKGNVVTFAGSCNGIVLLLIQNFRDHLILYNPLTKATSKPIPDSQHSHCNDCKKHVYGFGYGSSTPDDVKIVRFRGCEHWSSNDNRHTCDVFSLKTNSWIVLKSFVRNANRLNDVGTFANGSLYWIANSNHRQECKIVALDVNNMVLSDIHVPSNDHGLHNNNNNPRHRPIWVFLGTLHGCLCILGKSYGNKGPFNVWVMKRDGVDDKSLWSNVCDFQLKLKSEFKYSPLSILDNGIILIAINSFQELVMYDAMKNYPIKVINISATPSYFRSSHGIEYVESLVSPSSLFN